MRIRRAAAFSKDGRGFFFLLLVGQYITISNTFIEHCSSLDFNSGSPFSLFAPRITSSFLASFVCRILSLFFFQPTLLLPGGLLISERPSSLGIGNIYLVFAIKIYLGPQ